MAVSTQVVYFTKDASGTTNATQDVNLNFTPKAIIVMSCGIAANNTLTDGYATSWGFSDGTNHACVATVSQDNAGSGNTGRTHRTDSVFCRLNPTDGTTVLSQASVAFATNKVTFTWTVNDAVATYIVMKAFGGTDITNVKVNTIDMGASATGNREYTGLGFTPTDGTSVLFIMGSHTDGAANLNTQAVNAAFSFGCAVSATKSWAMSNCNEDTTASMDTDRYFRNDRCLNTLNSEAAGVNEEADFNGWLSDGFTLYWYDPPPATTFQMSYMVIKGGTWDAGTDTVPTTTSSKNHSVSVSSRTIRGLLMMNGFSNDFAFHTSATGTASFGCGVTDGTNMGYIVAGDLNGEGNAITASKNGSAQICGDVYPNATAAFSAVYYTGAISSFGTNQFTISYTEIADINAQVIAWVVVADAGEAPPAPEFVPYPSQSHANIHQMFDNRRENVIGTIFG